MTYHVLNGDALVNRFMATELGGKIIVMRECLIEGDLTGDTKEAFYQARANYLGATYPNVQKNYFDEVAAEFEQLSTAPNPSVFNLWFGYDLFCRTNMWFVLSVLHQLPIVKLVFVVYPSYLKGDDIWLDFGGATPEQLMYCYNNRIALADEDLQLANGLWRAYKQHDVDALTQLSNMLSAAFPYLKEVCQAHIDRSGDDGDKGRPEKAVEALLKEGNRDFASMFDAFSKREGIYGFGDSQIKRIYNKLLQNQ